MIFEHASSGRIEQKYRVLRLVGGACMKLNFMFRKKLMSKVRTEQICRIRFAPVHYFDLSLPSISFYTAYSTVSTTSTPAKLTQPIQWSSEYHDTELGIVYYNYRYYNSQDGRWTRRDPIGIEGGVNLYAYVENKPIHLSDALGNIKWAGYGALVEAVLNAANGYLQSRISNCPSKYPKSKADCEACIDNATAALIMTTTAVYTIGLVGCAALSLFLAIACIAALSYAKIMAMESIMEAKDNAMKGCCK